MNENLNAIVGLAKVRVDAGFSRVGRRLSASDVVGRALMILAARSISQGNAIMVLCERGLANEALPLLRALGGASSAMSWIVAGDKKSRAETVLAELDAPAWMDLFKTDQFSTRIAVCGLAPKIAEFVAGSAVDFARGGAQGLPWGHVYADATRPGKSPAEVLVATAAFLGHGLKALEVHWPGEFPGAEEMWDGIKNL